ncbi:MAG: Bax inhibitor-1/YccA family protein [Spirochaetales bacterium]|nr:Bax inhibitor-1/YccA family protein [Spirochaetales bacterium]
MSDFYRNTFSREAQAQKEQTILRNVYLWMTIGLLITAGVAWAVIQGGFYQYIFNSGSYLILTIAEVVLVIYLSRNIMRMNTGRAVAAFTGYSALNGLTLSVIFLRYTSSDISSAFIAAAVMFGVVSFWATVTKKDMSGWGHYLFMGLIGLLVAGLINMFFYGSVFSTIYSYFGVLLFTGLAAYDTQMIKRMSDQMSSQVDEASYVKLSILGALKLYLDFINMFLFILRIFGRRN